MVSRIYMDATGLRISAAGYNAETDDNPTHFIFDSRNRAYFGSFLTGYVSPSAFAGSSAGAATYDVMFGKTFSAPPPALVAFASASGGFSGYASNFLNCSGSSYMFGSFLSLADRIRFSSYGSFNGTNVEPPIGGIYFLVGES